MNIYLIPRDRCKTDRDSCCVSTEIREEEANLPLFMNKMSDRHWTNWRGLWCLIYTAAPSCQKQSRQQRQKCVHNIYSLKGDWDNILLTATATGNHKDTSYTTPYKQWQDKMIIFSNINTINHWEDQSFPEWSIWIHHVSLLCLNITETIWTEADLGPGQFQTCSDTNKWNPDLTVLMDKLIFSHIIISQDKHFSTNNIILCFRGFF